MKSIRSFLFIAICLCGSIALQAQKTTTDVSKEVKKEIDKPIETKAPPAPQLAPTSVELEPEKKENFVTLTHDPAQGKKNLTPEQQKTLKGEKEKPKVTHAVMPNTADPATSLLKPQPKPAAKQQEQQQ